MKKRWVYILWILSSCMGEKTSELVKEKPPIPPEKYVTSSIASFKLDTAYVTGKRFSGYLFTIDQTTNDTISKIGYLDGLMAGICKIWYRKNQLLEEREFKDGAKNGLQVAYWENGKIKFEFTAVNDAYEGELREWNVNGDLIHLGTYKNGQEEGPQKMWYDNGKIRANYIMRNGKRYGLLGTKNCVNVSDSIFVVK